MSDVCEDIEKYLEALEDLDSNKEVIKHTAALKQAALTLVRQSEYDPMTEGVVT